MMPTVLRKLKPTNSAAAKITLCESKGKQWEKVAASSWMTWSPYGIVWGRGFSWGSRTGLGYRLQSWHRTGATSLPVYKIWFALLGGDWKCGCSWGWLCMTQLCRSLHWSARDMAPLPGTSGLTHNKGKYNFQSPTQPNQGLACNTSSLLASAGSCLPPDLRTGPLLLWCSARFVKHKCYLLQCCLLPFLEKHWVSLQHFQFLALDFVLLFGMSLQIQVLPSV